MLTTRKSLSVLVVFLGLTSCHSFNRYTFLSTGQDPGRRDTELATASLSEEQIHPEGSNDSAPKKPTVSAVCPVYKLPQLPAQPELPYDKLSKLSTSSDPHAFDQVAEDQIKVLYAYISTVRHVLRDSHQEYLRQCQEYLNSGHQNSLGR